MTVYFTADTHFGHANIIKYQNRPFMTAEESARAIADPRGNWRVSDETVRLHDSVLLENINTRVQTGDILWILGDFCFRSLEDIAAYRKRIRCKTVNLVRGNHDHKNIDRFFNHTLEQGMIQVQGQKIWLNHYPMRSWHGSHRGAWQLYGHVHGALQAQDEEIGYTLTKDVGVDACHYAPLSFAQLEAYMQPRRKLLEERRAEWLEQDVLRELVEQTQDLKLGYGKDDPVPRPLE